MTDSFIRVAAATPTIRVADPAHNAERIFELMRRAEAEDVQLLCLPELCVTGYTCGDLFHQDALLDGALAALDRLRRESEALSLVTVAGLPIRAGGKLYNAAAVLHGGRVLGVVPKTHLPGYGEFYEPRHFTPAEAGVRRLSLAGGDAPFGSALLFRCEPLPAFGFAVELCEDLWAPNPPSIAHAMNGATLVVNLSASDETVGKAEYRRSLVAGQSARLICGYVYADAGAGESGTDMVFSAHNLVCENGAILAESPPFGGGWAASEIDVQAIAHDRMRMNTFAGGHDGYVTIPFSPSPKRPAPTRRVDPTPFVPADPRQREQRCEDILSIQSAGLAQRLEHVRAGAVIGVSGGLDSTLALLVASRAYKLLGKNPADLAAVGMPCFGTTNRTRANARRLSEALAASYREIDITRQVRIHLEELGHDESVRDVVYENAQARIRTLVLMDLANEVGGIVVGTGDLSELALGWATYNGDHMSMYGVNAGVPKTLVRHLVGHVADTCGDEALASILADILDTPVSPELLPPDGDAISQKTEDLVGPYELHDFFLYHLVRRGRRPERIHSLACLAFAGKYAPGVILRWLKVFIRRFFAQQFKRSCLPDGPKVGTITLSPRADWRMPSDAACGAWLEELEGLDEGG